MVVKWCVRVLLALYLSALYGAQSQVFQFNQVTTDDKGNRLKGIVAVQGNITLNPKISSCIKPEIGFQVVEKLCSIDLESCKSEKEAESSSNPCDCVKTTENDYGLYIRPEAKERYSGLNIQAVMTTKDAKSPVILGASTIGTVPWIKGADDSIAKLQATVEINRDGPKDLTENSKVSVCKDEFSTIKICLKHKDPEDEHSIILSNTEETSSGNSCVEMTWYYDFAKKPYNLKYKYVCKTGSAVFNAQITERKSGCRSTTSIKSKEGKNNKEDDRPDNIKSPSIPTRDIMNTTLPFNAICLSQQSNTGTSSLVIVNLPGGKRVLCDTKTDGGGWTVVQRRMTGGENFLRNWHAYEHGFGEWPDQMWYGLKNIHTLCSEKCDVRFEIGGLFGYSNDRAVTHKHFVVQDASEQYKMTVRAADKSPENQSPFTDLSGQKFYTWDKDIAQKCAHYKASAFWFSSSCGYININGMYNYTDARYKRRSMHWNWEKKAEKNALPVIYSVMKVRPILSPSVMCSMLKTTEGKNKDITTRIDGLKVACERKGGWVVIQRHAKDKLSFYRTWAEYKIGFGDVKLGDDFWFGLEELHLMCKDFCELQVDIEYKGEKRVAKYNYFTVEGEDKFYRMSVIGYSGDAGDALKHHNGAMFSTRDKDKDGTSVNCAHLHHGGWWYKSVGGKACDDANPNGNFGVQNGKSAMTWGSLTGETKSIDSIQLKVRSNPMTDGRFCPYTDIKTNWIGAIFGGWHVGKKIYIYGTPQQGIAQFTVNILSDKITLMHMGNRFKMYNDRRKTVWNFHGGNGRTERRTLQRWPFEYQTEFEMKIEAMHNRYIITVNGVYYESFKYHFDDINLAQRLQLAQGFDIRKVCFSR